MASDSKVLRGKRGPNKTKGAGIKLLYPAKEYKVMKRVVEERLITSPFKDCIPRCVVGQEPVYYMPAYRSHCPGHIGTHLGMLYFHDTGICEYHSVKDKDIV